MFDDQDFVFTDLPEETKDPEISEDDFVLQQADSAIHEQKFQTKPTTFLKDSFKRFRKNKSSVVAAFILGILVLLAIFVPIFNTNDVSNAADSALKNLEPKLFNGGGFWDGTLSVYHKEIDPVTGLPDPDLYLPGGVQNIKYEPDGFVSQPSKYGKGGYLQSGFYGSLGVQEAFLTSASSEDFSNSHSRFNFLLDLEHTTLTLDKFVVADEEMMKKDLGDNGVIPENFTIGLTSLLFEYEVETEKHTIELVTPKKSQTIGLEGGDAPINISNIILSQSEGVTKFNNFKFTFRTSKTDSSTDEDHICSLIKSFVVSTSSTNLGEKMYFSSTTDEKYKTHGISFDDAMQVMVTDDIVKVTIKEQEGAPATRYVIKNPGYYISGPSTKFVKKIYLARASFASFTYDSYQATLGRRIATLDNYKMQAYVDAGYIDFDIRIQKIGSTYKIVSYHCDILMPDKCPMVEVPDVSAFYDLEYHVDAGNIFKVDAEVIYYKYLGYETMPKYLFGTDKTGRDMFKYVFEGLRNSLILGVITFAVCFTFGLLWGAISGYFGGAVDLVMERLTDILSGVPWIVVMTLVVLKAGSSIGTFAFALCLTGWIGTAATTRTQFYRFRGREYVLASRTLGASDARLIFKHILPNAMGTIITGAVLMIPSVIFSEATISYLGLGFKDLSSLGVILSNNQAELTNHPYQLIFPSVVIALVMISFNLFGNGLRDAINPSLKGESE